MKPFFIVGAQRSGTTLLRLILNAHSQVAIPEEGTFWMPLIRLHSGNPDGPIPRKTLLKYLSYIRKNRQFRLWGMEASELVSRLESSSREMTLRELMEAFYSAYAAREGKQLWGEKSSVFFRKIKELNDIFPEVKFIHIVRDGRDVFLSWRKLLPKRRNVCVSALEWRHKVGRIETSFEVLNPERHLTIRYEDLVTAPDVVLERLCAFLGVDPEAAMEEFWKKSDRYIGSHHSDLIFQPISPTSIGKWKKQMKNFETRAYEAIAGPALQRYGYDITCQRRELSVYEQMKMVFYLAAGLPARALEVAGTALRLWLAAKLGLETKAAGSGDMPGGKMQ